jgi:hypothetical protein
MKIMEMNLANAVLAIDIDPTTAEPSIRDICADLRNQFGSGTSPVHVASFHTDFVIQFATAEERDHVLLHEFLYADNFSMILIPWNRNYRSRTILWQTLVAIDVSHLPPHASYADSLQPLLSPHCKVLNYKFNKRAGACQANAFALNTSSIPRPGQVAVQYAQENGVSTKLSLSQCRHIFIIRHRRLNLIVRRLIRLSPHHPWIQVIFLAHV